LVLLVLLVLRLLLLLLLAAMVVMVLLLLLRLRLLLLTWKKSPGLLSAMGILLLCGRRFALLPLVFFPWLKFVGLMGSPDTLGRSRRKEAAAGRIETDKATLW